MSFKEDIKVSVILPSLDVAPYVEECVESVANQTLQELEILCVDAGSVDGTEEILRRYAEKDERIQVIHSEYKSYGHQVNTGLERAMGKYIAVVETDDFIRDTMYEELYQIAEKTQADFVKADYEMIKALKNGNYSFERFYTLKQYPELYNSILEEKDIPKLFPYDASLWKGIYRRDFLENNSVRLNESPGASYQDTGFVMQTLLRAKRVYYLNKPFYCYRVDREEASSRRPECFSRICREISWILRNGILKDVPAGLKHAAIFRLACVFLWGIEVSAKSGLFDDQSKAFKDAYPFFHDTMDAWIDGGELSEDDFTAQQWEDIQLALSDIEKLISIRRAEAERQKMFYDQLTNNQFVIFGYGRRGKRLLSECVKREIQPAFICDNHAALWGSVQEGIQILPPEECVKRCPGALFVIANKDNREEIEAQLLKNKIQKERLSFFE